MPRWSFKTGRQLPASNRPRVHKLLEGLREELHPLVQLGQLDLRVVGSLIVRCGDGRRAVQVQLGLGDVPTKSSLLEQLRNRCFLLGPQSLQEITNESPASNNFGPCRVTLQQRLQTCQGDRSYLRKRHRKRCVTFTNLINNDDHVLAEHTPAAEDLALARHEPTLNCAEAVTQTVAILTLLKQLTNHGRANVGQELCVAAGEIGHLHEPPGAHLVGQRAPNLG
mmetsp:Transcript_33756/g.87738  ORF Transcript_33756/g.87738 Transcript_33756/m.87738 type:complete len:224 (-) Transcript_33756:1429-2100(-)